MKEAITPAPFQEELKRIQAMKPVKWARIKDGYLYFCTRPKMLRHWTPTGEKYLPQIKCKISATMSGGHPEFQYLWGRSGLKRHGYTAMSRNYRIGVTRYLSGCIGEAETDYRYARRRGGLVAGVESLIQSLQTVY